MTLLFRYLTHQVANSFALALTSLVLLFGIFDLIGELDVVRSDGYTVGRAFIYIILGMPGRIQELLPIAALLGAIFAFTRLAANSEFTVMRASGLSTARLTIYMAVLGLFLAVATLLVGEYLTPPAERLAQQIKIRGTSGIVAQEFRSGLWAKDGHSFVNIRQMLPDTTLVDVRMYEFDQDFQLQRIRLAESARWSAAAKWQLQGVTETTLSATFPLAAPVMLLIALPFAYQQPRAGKVGGRVMLGILIGLGFHLLNRMFGNIGLLNDWPPALSALLPLMVFSAAALIALRRVEAR